MRWIPVVVGVVLVLLGGLWMLQGVGIVGGSVMTGQAFWAIVGTILLIAGMLLCVFGLRRRPSPPSR
jgi:uncharacterized membrane protein HdeD (DUF308 family)